MTRAKVLCLSLSLSLALSLGLAGAATRLPPGGGLGEVALQDLEDRSVPLSSYGGKVLVLIHEDKDAGAKNRALKAGLGRLGERGAYRDRLVVVAVADVSRFDFWPARRYARDALKAFRDKERALVLCDWKGVVRRRYGLPRGESTLLVLRPDGRLSLGLVGDLSPAEAAQALSEIERLLL